MIAIECLEISTNISINAGLLFSVLFRYMDLLDFLIV